MAAVLARVGNSANAGDTPTIKSKGGNLSLNCGGLRLPGRWSAHCAHCASEISNAAMLHSTLSKDNRSGCYLPQNATGLRSCISGGARHTRRLPPHAAPLVSPPAAAAAQLGLPSVLVQRRVLALQGAAGWSVERRHWQHPPCAALCRGGNSITASRRNQCMHRDEGSRLGAAELAHQADNVAAAEERALKVCCREERGRVMPRPAAGQQRSHARGAVHAHRANHK